MAAKNSTVTGIIDRMAGAALVTREQSATLTKVAGHVRDAGVAADANTGESSGPKSGNHRGQYSSNDESS